LRNRSREASLLVRSTVVVLVGRYEELFYLKNGRATHVLIAERQDPVRTWSAHQMLKHTSLGCSQYLVEG
jgi:hypothetical protein